MQLSKPLYGSLTTLCRHLMILALLSLIVSCGRSKNKTATAPGVTPPTLPPTSIDRDFRDITISSLGDSITTATNSTLLFTDDFSKSWSVGNSLALPGSHYQRILELARLKNIPVRPFMYARSGGKILSNNATSLRVQAELLASRLDTQDLNYVTLLMGGNDVCQESLPASDFKSRVRSRLEEALDRIGPKADLILLASLPDLNAVLDPVNCSMSPTFREFVLNTLCPNSQSLNEVELAKAVTDINEAMEEAAASSPYNVVFDNKAVYNSPVSGDLISNFDCFHPSVQGHQSFSSTLWPFVESYFVDKVNN